MRKKYKKNFKVLWRIFFACGVGLVGGHILSSIVLPNLPSRLAINILATLGGVILGLVAGLVTIRGVRIKIKMDFINKQWEFIQDIKSLLNEMFRT